MTKKGLNIEGPGNKTWAGSITAYNERLHYTPTLIVYPRSAMEVSAAVTCAAAQAPPKVSVSALSGGHSYAAGGYGARDGSLVLNMREMTGMVYNAADGTASVQPGARLGDVAIWLKVSAGRAMAHGVCAYVGIGGHSGLGGFGYASRNWGLLIDQVVGADVVLANGTLVHASKTQNSELFWAIRGAAPSFGIVTQYTYMTHPEPPNVVRFSYSFSNPTLSATKFAAVIRGYQKWVLTVPKELGIGANVWDTGKTVEIGGFYMGSEDEFKTLIAGLLKETGEPNGKYMQVVSWLDALTQVNGGQWLDTTTKPDTHDTFYAKSLVVPESAPLTDSALTALFVAATKPKTSNPSSLSWFIQFEAWGGGNSAISAIPSNATAYPHRSHLFTMQLYATTGAGGKWPAQGNAFVNGMVNAITGAKDMLQVKFGAYANYIDPELHGWREMYYAGNYGRLDKLRKVLDPRGVFMKPQNIGAPDF
ncbi:FAD-binding domain-containing protein [Mycena kentingensis (nom. inval.)]|nr:FAD-binding domain-containing protein [Mycena kentingensis (nom. inval.)]